MKAGKNEMKNNIPLGEEELRNLEMIVLYHGTNGELVDNILNKGLLPWNLVGGHNWDMLGGDMFGFYTPKINCVYLATFDRALEYANYLVQDGVSKDVVVIELEVDTKRLLPDEDSNEKTWSESFLKVGCCAHKGIIDPGKIKRIYGADKRIVYQRNNVAT